jgi:branched-chain amino acid transport system permease protein
MVVLGFVGLVEMLSFMTIGAAEGKTFNVLGLSPDLHTSPPWLIVAACVSIGAVWLRREARLFRRVWDTLMADLGPAGNR